VNGVKQRGGPDEQSALRGRRHLTIAVVILLLLGGGLWLGLATREGEHRPPRPPTAAPPSQAPSEPGAPAAISLDGWKLTIPEEGKNGNAAIIQPAETSPPWLTGNPDGSLTFWAPAVGATTKNSQHPRTELVSLNNFAAGSGPHTLNTSLSVAQVPSDTKDIILGQIHGADDISSVPYVMLHYQAGNIRVVVKTVQDGDSARTYPLLTGIPLGQRFDFTISDLGNGSMVFAATYGAQTQRVTAPIPATFTGATVRFQVGDYQQAKDSDDPSDGGRVTFYRVDEVTTAP
jgi:alginate lyase